MVESQWTVQMLATELLDTRSDLRRHIAGCEDGQRENTRVTLEMASKLDDVVRTVGGYQRVISGSWAGVGRVLVGVIAAVGAAVVVLSIQNATLHRDTASKVEATAATVAKVATVRSDTADADQKARDEEIIALLKKRR